jgi:GxxExxY protein
MINNQYKYSDITEKIIKCSFAVHNIIGCGFQEVVYQRALAIELDDCGLQYIREQEMPLFYKDHHIGTRRVDFLVDEKVLVEIKAISKLEDVHFVQAINYLQAFKLEVGLLINFGSTSVEFKRVMKNEYQLKKGNQIGYNNIKEQ